MAKMLQSWIGRAALTAVAIAMASFMGAIAVNSFGSVAAQSCRVTGLGILAADVSRAGELGAGDCERLVAAGRERWVDVYTFNLAEPAGVRITMLSDSGIDAYLILSDGDGVEIVRDDDGGPGSGAQIAIGELAAGSYRLEATNWQIDGWTSGGSYSYQLMISLLDPPGGVEPEAPRVAPSACRVTGLGTLAADVSRAGELGAGDCETSVGGRDRWADVYTFNLAVPAGVRITMRSGSGIDAYLILRDGDGTEIARDDDGGPGSSAQIEIGELAAGSYRLEATNWQIDGWASGGSYSYQLAISLLGQVVVEAARADSSACTVIPLGILTTTDVSRAGELGVGDCEALVGAGKRWADVYTFNLAVPAGVRITMRSDSGIDAYLILRDGDGTEIARDDDGGPGSSAQIEIGELAAGSYRLEATNWQIDGWASGGSYSYQLAISLLGQVVVEAARADSSACTVIPLGILTTTDVSRAGELGVGDCEALVGGRDRWADVYTFNLAVPAGVRITMRSGSGIDAYLILRDGDGTEIARDDDGGPGSSAQIEIGELAAGSYRLEATNWQIDGWASGGSYSYQLAISLLGQVVVEAARADSSACTVIPLGILTTTDVSRAGELGVGDCEALVGAGKRWADVYTFNLAVPAGVRITMRSDSGIDAYLILRDGDGTEIARDDDGGPGSSAQIEIGELAAGSYRLEATNWHIYGWAADRSYPYGLSIRLLGQVVVGAVAFTGPVADQRWQLGRRVSLTLPAVEGSAGRVSYELQHRFRDESFDRSLPPGLAFDSRSRQLSGTLSPGDVLDDSHRFRYTAVDEDGTEAVVEFGASIRLPDDFSWIGDAEVPDQDWTIGESIERVQLPAARSAAGRVTYSMRWERQGVQSAGAPPGLSFNAGTRTLSGTPTGLPGPFTIFYRATEPTGVYRQIEIGANQEAASVAGGCEVSPLGTLRQGEVKEWADQAGGDCLWELDGERWRSDWYSFRLAERTRLMVEMRSLSRPNLVIRHADGRIIEGPTAIRTTTEARIALLLDPGEYQIRAMQDAGSETYFRNRARFGARSSWGYSIKASLASPVEMAHFDLAMKYAPTLHFETNEKYLPVPVEMMIERSELKQSQPQTVPLIGNIPFSNDITMQRQGSVSADDLGRAGRGTYLDLDNARRKDEGPPTIYANIHQFDKGTLLQYWFFYLYNSNAGSDLISNHEGDWESFQLYFADQSIADLLSGDIAPDEVGFASHEEGFAGVNRRGTGTAACGKFDVYVANGRHASYPEEGTGTTGFFEWDGARPNADGGADAAIELEIGGVGIVRRGDEYAGGRTWGGPGTGSDVTYEIRMLSPNAPPWLQWQGHWGERIWQIKGLGVVVLGGGPKGPKAKPHWALIPSQLVRMAGWLPLQFDCATPTRNWSDYRTQFNTGR